MNSLSGCALPGQSVRRLEDERFLTGAGAYVGDLHLPGMCHGVTVHSPHAHALIRSIDVSAAEASPGVLCVLTGAMADAEGLGGLQPYAVPEHWGGPPSYRTEWRPLVTDRVRMVGDRVAFVVAETLHQARDAAERVVVEYDLLEAVVTAEGAVAPGAPELWPGCAGNVCFTLEEGDRAAVDQAFAAAAHVVELQVDNRRLAPNAMEPRAAVGAWQAGTRSYVLHTSSQNPHGVRSALARSVLRIPERLLRVISPDVGGGFGGKANPYPEDALVLWASRRCGRPVKWVATRAESLMTDNHGRDQTAEGALALDADGRILALRADLLHAFGAYFASASAAPVLTAIVMATSVYAIPILHIRSRAVFTNTAPVGVYRGAGRPEANFLLERLIERAAAATGLDRVELRRRNLVPAAAMPHRTATGKVYDTGDFPHLLSECVRLADWDGFASRQAASTARGLLRGWAVSSYIEYAGVMNERMDIRFDPGGEITILAGTHSHGQGHATTYAQLLSDHLHVPRESIRFVQGDTDHVPFGRGTYAARSSMLGGCALIVAADAVIMRARPMAAHMLGVAEDAVAFDEGAFHAAGANRYLSLPDVAKACFAPHLPAGMVLGLEASGTWAAEPPNYPNGCHACEVEIDPETGEVHVDRYTMVDDVGRMINPMICEGQVHGGLAQGLGQALLEAVVYEPSGQLLSGSFMDYAMPRADTMPDIRSAFVCTPSTTNTLGIKAVGESAVIASPAVVVNALLDALRPLGVEDLQMPVTAGRVMAAILAAGSQPPVANPG